MHHSEPENIESVISKKKKKICQKDLPQTLNKSNKFLYDKCNNRQLFRCDTGINQEQQNPQLIVLISALDKKHSFGKSQLKR